MSKMNMKIYILEDAIKSTEKLSAFKLASRGTHGSQITGGEWG